MIQANELKKGNVPDWEDYQVTKSGRVFSIRRNKFLKVWVGKSNEYPRVSLSKNNKEKSFCVHRLVAMAYIPNPDNKKAVNHKDGNKHNNCVNNLEWVTFSENTRHAIINGLSKPLKNKKGELHYAAKLNNVDIAMIKVLSKYDFTNEQIAKRFNVHPTHISAIKLNKTWKHLEELEIKELQPANK